MKRFGSLALLGAVLVSSGAFAQYSDGVIKIGVMNDMSGTYSDLSGQGSVVAARMAVEDFGAATKGMKVEIVGADHQNKPDVGSNVVRTWIDREQVDVVVDVPTSSVALAVSEITRDKNKVFLVSGAGASDLTGAKCSPNTIHWTYDTWALGNGTGAALVKTGGDTWFFLTADYAFGHALERDTAAVVEKNGGKVPSPAPISPPSCCRRKLPRRRSSASPMPAATPSIPSSRRRNSASCGADRTLPRCSPSSAMCMRSACRRRRA
jgi:branched-chain amino acid transport system substrate-binding protein